MTWSKPKLSPEGRRALYEAGWQVLSLHQPPWLFPRDGRKLVLVPQAADPWHVTLHNGATVLTATRFLSAQGATPDEAVAAALSDAGTDVRTAMGRLEAALDGLIGVLRQ